MPSAATTCLVPRAPDAELNAIARRTLGAAPSILHYLAPCPWLARAEIAVYAARRAHVSSRIFELVPYAVALDRRSPHLIGSLAAFLRIGGHTKADLAAVEAAPPFAGLTALEATALEHAVEVARGRGRETLARMTLAGHDIGAQTEVTALAATVVFGAYVATPLAVPADPIERFEGTLLAKLLMPLIRNRVQAMRNRKPATASADHGSLFADVVALLAGSPLHDVARDALLGAWQSAILPNDDKAVIMAAVSESLGATTMSAAIQTLSSGSRSARADALREYARVTVEEPPDAAYPAAQRLGRSLTTVELLEVIGIAALANALARIELVLARPL